MGIIKAGERIDYITIMRLFKLLKDKEYSVKVESDYGDIEYVRNNNLAHLTPDLYYDNQSSTVGVFHTSTKAGTLIFMVLRDRNEPELFFTGNPIEINGNTVNHNFHERLPITKETRELYKNSNGEIDDIDWDLEILIYPYIDFASENSHPFYFNLGNPNLNYPATSPRSNIEVFFNYDVTSVLYVELLTSLSNAGVFNAYSPYRYGLSVAKSFNISSFRIQNLHKIIKLRGKDKLYPDYSKHAGTFLKIPEADIDLVARPLVTFEGTGLRVEMVLNTNIFHIFGFYYLFIDNHLPHLPQRNMYTYNSSNPKAKTIANYSFYSEFEKIATEYMDDSTYPLMFGGATGFPDINLPVTQVLLNRMSETVYNDTFQSDFLYDDHNQDPVEANYRIIFGYRNFIANMDTTNLDQAGLYYQCQTSEGTIVLDNLTANQKEHLLQFFPEILKKITLREVNIHS